MNVDQQPDAVTELRQRFGVLVPALVVGDRVAHGWNPPAYAQLVGVSLETGAKLPPRELADRLDRVLECCERLLSVVPDNVVTYRPPERNRTLRELGYHVFRLSSAFADGMDRGEFPEGWLQEKAPPEISAGADVAAYGALVRARLQGWFAGVADTEFARVIRVYYGPQSGHELLERTTWHAAQHLRQLYDLSARVGVTPPLPMPTDALRGLPLPDALW